VTFKNLDRMWTGVIYRRDEETWSERYCNQWDTRFRIDVGSKGYCKPDGVDHHLEQEGVASFM
jgi:hypothetical protein